MRYCLRRWNEQRSRALIWELTDDNVATGVCYDGYRSRSQANLLFCTPMRGHKGPEFQADTASFVPLSKVVCKYDSQLSAIRRDVEDGVIRYPGAMPDSLETVQRFQRQARTGGEN